ncbi:hypothetical protein BCD67_25165 [Oscillatoriales cyanobacterium USR001]|nr:hypothetical protein BCD67_25165 [Oscillatoriales cyanobacterium USR001]
MLMEHLGGAIASLFFPIEEIPLQQSKDGLQVQYLSPIALKVANIQQKSPMDIAIAIADYCQEESTNQSCLNREYFTVEVVPPGIILFKLTALGVANWLQTFPSLIKQKMTKGEREITSLCIDSDRYFPIQYSHARCCSILKLADRDRIIELADRDRPHSSPDWQIITPNPIPWLDDRNHLRLFHLAELSLISQLFTTLDNLSPLFQENLGELMGHLIIGDRAANWSKLAKALSDAFQTFYSQCRIWGEVQKETPKLAQARLGLVIGTQVLLQFILQELLGVFAPLEL